MELGLGGKVALVTGASSGIGRATALSLAEEGVRVALSYNSNKAGALETADCINEGARKRGEPSSAVIIQCDISSEDSVRGCFETTLRSFGQLDILINNAGYWPSGYVGEMESEDWRRCLDVNLTGHFLCAREFVRHKSPTQSGGRITNIVSFAGFLGSTTGHAHYASAKAGLVALTKSLAKEFCPHGILVNAVSPGMVETDMTKAISGEEKNRYLARIPLGRFASPQEIANVVVFLSSERASYVTGSTFDVSGGVLMH
ncbi:MAG: 3-oxoacyl-ACP reductase FabG [Spirochaetaceae bacterium]|nr:MAG: 3-oxoacyl-ACP reductase FabG [Spirochaetaceae bacterium]